MTLEAQSAADISYIRLFVHPPEGRNNNFCRKEQRLASYYPHC
ncbi:MAG: hypothetical protein QW303_07130 [Nitrososphaerota archaeon]